MTDQNPASGAPGEGAPDGAGEFDVPDDISGIDNWLEEGGPVEPQDVAEVEAAPSIEEQLATARAQLAERTDDLQRKQAELLNFRARVERDREVTRENAKYQVLAPIIEVLDTIDRAREHGELEPGLKTVADQLERTVAAQGLTRFGVKGDPFDPNLHEALAHQGESADVTVTTVAVVAKSGYKIGDRVVRAAQVLVVDPPG